MINNKRVVPIVNKDYLTLVGEIFALGGTSYTALQASDVEGTFTAIGTGDIGNVLAAQPLKSLNFASGVTAAVVYFVAAYDYVGFAINGTATVTAGATVKADAITLYKATLSSGTVTIAAVSPVVA